MTAFIRNYIQFVLVIGITMSAATHAANTTVFELTVAKPMTEVYPSVSRSFEDSRFFVVEEINIGKSLSGFAEKWGSEYNHNGLSEIRSMVFCNGWYANQVSNLDPAMLGLCPLHLTLYEKDGHSTVLFNRPTVISVGSPANALLLEIEQEVIEIIKKGMR